MDDAARESAPAPSDDVISGIDFEDDHYLIEQSLVRNKYAVYDSSEQLVCRAKQKLFKMKEEFPFVDPDGNQIFTIKAKNILDIAGDYALTDSQTGETIAIIQKQFTFFKHVWKIRSPDDERLLATIESQSALLEALRNISFITGLIPHKYDIDGGGGRQIGRIEGQFSIRDRYDLYVGDTGDAPREAVVAAAIAIDALEGN